MTVVAARLLVSGAVQGVGYRAWTTRAARALGLCGFVRNLDDGRVEIVAQGTVSALDSLVSQCGQGPPSARVDDQRNLREQAKNLADDDECARSAIASALRYIRTRKDQMRYASHHQANLPIGSGATESTCWQMQQRVKLPGHSWEPPGLRGVLAIRGLVLSERWEPAWNHYAESHRYEVNAVL